MLTITYDPTGGVTFDDGVVEQKVLGLYEMSTRGPVTLRTSNEFVVLAARALIAEGKIPHDAIEFVFNGYVIQHSKVGRLSQWPDGFCDVSDKLLMRILDAQNAKE